MVFYLIGLGLSSPEDVSLKGLKIIQSAKRVYLEMYTAILMASKEEIEATYGREVILADRDMVEQESDVLLKNADSEDVCFLVVGDVFGATTHSDLVIRCKEDNIPYKVIHNASIMTAIGACGLQLYNFGETVSFCFWDGNWKPDSYYDKIRKNRSMGLHTLCLLDIKVKEQTVENLMKGNKIFEPPRYMKTDQAAAQLLEIIKNKNEGLDGEIDENTLCIGLARVGSDDQKISAGPLVEMAARDLGEPLHCFVVTGKLHPMETEFLEKIYGLEKK